MNSKGIVKVISVVTVFICIFAFVAGIVGFADGLTGVRSTKDDYQSFKKQADDYRTATDKINSGRSEYEAQKSAYDAEKATFDADKDAYDSMVKDYEIAVVEYNQKLMQFSVGKSAMGSGVTAYEEGRRGLDSGWAAYEEGRKAFEAGKAEFESKMSEYSGGKALYEAGLMQYEGGLQQYEQIVASLAALEAYGLSHEAALASVSAQLGIPLTDESLTTMKEGLDNTKDTLDQVKLALDMAEDMIPDAEKQLQAGESAMSETYAQLMQAEEGLNAALAQINSSSAQINSMGSQLGGDRNSLTDTSAVIAEESERLDNKEAELEAAYEPIRDYQRTQEKAKRLHDIFIDAGYAGSDSSDAELISGVDRHVSDLRRLYLRDFLGEIIAFVLLLISCTAAFISSLTNGKKERRAVILAGVSAVAALLSIAFAELTGALNFASVLAGCLLIVGVAVAVYFIKQPVEE
ncbi:MAG: hypothetical protein HUJ66_00980 [Oscillospiraceae bacterium]|nr:hypothetical protein [Oscillospiraceae bacterium]